MSEKFYSKIEGYCPICEKPTSFIATGPWYRGTLMCSSCINGSTPRERALAYILNRERPDWKSLTIHESSPMNRGVSMKIRGECKNYIGTHFFPDKEPGSIIDGWRNENIENQTFASESFDIVISLDLTEHVFDPQKMFREIYRTLKRGGVYISTFPIRKQQVDPIIKRARMQASGQVEHLVEKPEYHGNPIDPNGSLVTFDYGYDIHTSISEFAPFSVEISRFSDRYRGILGEYTEVILCQKH